MGLVSATDKTVRDVGKAFQDAGNPSNSVIPPGARNHLEPGPSIYQYATITLDDQTVLTELAEEEQDQQLLQSLQQGMDLAAAFNKGPITAALLNELAAHENDPNFWLAFMNGLDHATLAELLL